MPEIWGGGTAGGREKKSEVERREGGRGKLATGAGRRFGIWGEGEEHGTKSHCTPFEVAIVRQPARRGTDPRAEIKMEMRTHHSQRGTWRRSGGEPRVGGCKGAAGDGSDKRCKWKKLLGGILREVATGRGPIGGSQSGGEVRLV